MEWMDEWTERTGGLPIERGAVGRASITLSSIYLGWHLEPLREIPFYAYFMNWSFVGCIGKEQPVLDRRNCLNLGTTARPWRLDGIDRWKNLKCMKFSERVDYLQIRVRCALWLSDSGAQDKQGLWKFWKEASWLEKNASFFTQWHYCRRTQINEVLYLEKEFPELFRIHRNNPTDLGVSPPPGVLIRSPE